MEVAGEHLPDLVRRGLRTLARLIRADVDPLPGGDVPCAVHDDEPIAPEVLPLGFVVPV